jgi:hypothetical protein
MNRLQLIIVGGILGFLSSGAVAFQESKGGTQGEPGQPGTPIVSPLDTEGTGVSIDQRGTEIRIPGLGKLGVLPKFDFGLDLLYGVNEPKPMTPGEHGPATDDVQIRGSLKHRF